MTTATDLPPAELQAAARAAYLEAAATGQPPTGTELGRQFNRSGRWGRDRIAECRQPRHSGPATDRQPELAGGQVAPATHVRDASEPGGGHHLGRAAAPAEIDGTANPHRVDIPASDEVPAGSYVTDRSTGARGDDESARPSTNGGGSHPIVRLAVDAPAASLGPPSTSDGSPVAATNIANMPGGSHLAATTGPLIAHGRQEAMWSRRIIRWTTTSAVIVVAACAARSSYEHQRTVVEMAGNPDAAWYLPMSVDGMMLIASLNMLVRRWDGEPAGWLTWTALLLGGAASLAANIAAAPPTLIGRLVAAWSPICLIVSYELLMQQLPNRTPPSRSGQSDPN